MTDRFRVRHLRGALVAALIVLAGCAVPARAQTERPPLEDVVLRGRILRPDGKPLAHTPLRVDAVEDDAGFRIFSFFASFGLSTLTCFDPDSDVCPVGGDDTTRFNSTTDASGRYSFTFPNAHYKGEQTNTDYYLSVAMPAHAGAGRAVVATYELELWDAVHDAPDLVLWDPSLRVKPGARLYGIAFAPRPDSSNTLRVMVGTRELLVTRTGDGSIDARAIEDQTVNLVLNAAKDVRAARTTYHQRFISAPYVLKGGLVPLSRGGGCSAARADGSVVGTCNHTDGDLTTPGVSAAVQEVTAVTVDLGAPKQVGEVRTRCACEIAASTDGATWHDLPATGTLNSAQSLRFVRVTGTGVTQSPEISVWPPWPDDAPASPLARAAPGGGDSAPDGRPWLLAAIALVVLVLSGRNVYRAARRA